MKSIYVVNKGEINVVYLFVKIGASYDTDNTEICIECKGISRGFTIGTNYLRELSYFAVLLRSLCQKEEADSN